MNKPSSAQVFEPTTSVAHIPTKFGKVSDAEWAARIELAAAYRLTAHFGWTHLVNNHISLRVPGTTDQFLLNPYGLLYEQITASSLVRIDLDGNVLEDTPFEINKAGFVIHSAIHMARPDLHAVMHTHTIMGQAVSALDCGLLPLNQASMRFYGHVAYHDYEGISREIDERTRLVQDLGPEHKVMILRNHGLLTAGVNIGEAFHLMYHLEKACHTQMMVMGSNQKYSFPAPEVCARAAKQFYRPGRVMGALDWKALHAFADTLDPSYRN